MALKQSQLNQLDARNVFARRAVVCALCACSEFSKFFLNVPVASAAGPVRVACVGRPDAH